MANKKRREFVEHLRYRVFVLETLNTAMEILKRLPEGEAKHKLREGLRHYIYNNNYSCTITPERPIEPEYKLLIRDDCNGDIYAVDKSYLSFHYRYALKNAGVQSYASEDYVKALQRNKAWADMNSFPTYHSIEELIRIRMEEMQLPPNLVQAMRINDFRDFVRNNCTEEFVDFRKKNSFIKAFIKARESEFRHLLAWGGVDERYTDALVEKMREKGEAWGVVVLDENGDRIEGPEFDRHHTIPVYSPNDVSSLSEVNDFNKLCLIEKKFHRWLHRLERAKIIDDALYFEKIMVPEHAACVFDFETCILHDFDHPERNIPPMCPSNSNLIYVNKIAEMSIRLNDQLAKQSKKTSGKSKKATGKYIKGGKGGRN